MKKDCLCLFKSVIFLPYHSLTLIIIVWQSSLVYAVCFTFKSSVPHAQGDLCSILLTVSISHGFMQGNGIQQHGIMESLNKQVDLKWNIQRKQLFCWRFHFEIEILPCWCFGTCILSPLHTTLMHTVHVTRPGGGSLCIYIIDACCSNAIKVCGQCFPGGNF